MRPWWDESGQPLPKTPRQKWIETKESWERSRHIVVPAPVPAAPARPGGLRVAFLIYRGNPRCGGQGVYTRHLTRELVALGHSVEVFAGPALARAGRRGRLHPGARARPLPRPGPLSGATPARVHLAGRTGSSSPSCARPASASPWPSRARVRQILAAASRRLRRRPRQPVPGQRACSAWSRTAGPC